MTGAVNQAGDSANRFVESAINFLLALEVWQIQDAKLEVDHDERSFLVAHNSSESSLA